MRLLVLLVMTTVLSGCSAMLLSGSADSNSQNECEQNDKKEQGREC